MLSKWINFKIILFLFLFFQALPDTIHAQPLPGPQAFLPATHYEFPPVFEGQMVRHEFVIQNKGTALLDITDVRTG